MKQAVYLILAFSVLIFLVSLAGYFFNSRTLQVESFYASVNVTDNEMGFDLNKSALIFGNVAKGGRGTRKINFYNDYNFPVFAQIEVEGNIKPLLLFDEIVRVEKGEEKKIVFVAYASKDIERGFHDGDIKIKIKPAR